MSLKDIRTKNLKTDSFANDYVNYDSLSEECVESIKKDVFENFVKPNTYKTLEKIK